MLAGGLSFLRGHWKRPKAFCTLCMCSVKQLCVCLIFFIILYNLEERKASITSVIYGLIFTCHIRVRDLVQETKRDCEPRTKATRLRTKSIFLGALSPLALLGKPTACSPCKGFQVRVLPRWSLSLSLSLGALHGWLRAKPRSLVLLAEEIPAPHGCAEKTPL